MRPKKKPAYQHHKASGQAKVRVNGQDTYLGKYGSPESYERYEEIVSDWMIRNQNPKTHALTLDELALLYLEFANGHYRKNGKLTNEVACIKTALREGKGVRSLFLVFLWGEGYSRVRVS